MTTAVPPLPTRLQRAGWMVAIAIACGTVAPARAQSVPAKSLLAYTQAYCECTGACDAFCASPNASVVVASSWQSAGPSDHTPSWAPDATRIAFVRGTDIVVVNVTSGTHQNLTNTATLDFAPAWSPDGRRIAFLSDRDAQAALYLMNADGSAVVRLTTNPGFRSWARLTWSPDSMRIGFDCEVDAGNEDICVIGVDGAGFRRLTAHPAKDRNPAWSPDGQRIAFATDRYAPGMDTRLAVMSADGSAVSQLGAGIPGWSPAWSTDGTQIGFEVASQYVHPDLYVMDAAGSGVTLIIEAATSAAWPPASGALIATFSIDCARLVCQVDASSSSGGITGYSWDFGDGATASGSTASHTYSEGGPKNIVLTLTGANSASRTASQGVTLDRPPIAAITASCEWLTCVFDWSGSYDPDGTGLDGWFDWGSDGVYDWQYVNNSSTMARLTYPEPGTYTATIGLYDDWRATYTSSQTFTLTAPPMHVGDIDIGSASQQNTWPVTVEVHDASHRPVYLAVVTVSGIGTASCRTDATGRCVVKIKASPKASVTVTNVTQGKFTYEPEGNHDPDGDSNGTAISVPKK